MVREILKEGKISVREHFLENQPLNEHSQMRKHYLCGWIYLSSDDLHVICICKAITDSLQ